METSQESVVLNVTNPKWIEKYFEIGSKPMKLYDYQLKFLKDKRNKRIVLKARQTGFSTIIALEALLRCINSDKTILVVSVAERQALEIINKIKKFLVNAEKLRYKGTDLFKIVRETKKEFLFGNGSRIISLPNNPQAARGYTADYIYLDEFAWLDNGESMMTAIEPSLSRGGSLTLVSTPAGKVGMFYDVWNEAKKRGYSKHKVHWKLCPDKIYRKNILEFKNRMDAFSFEQEYELQFLSEGMGFFSPRLVRPCIIDGLSSRLLKNDNYVQFGMDIGKVKSNTVLIVVEKNEEISEDNVKRSMIYVRKMKLWRLGTDYEEIKSDFKGYAKTYRPVIAKVDSSGVGDRFADEIRKEFIKLGNSTSIMPTKFSAPMKERMFGELRTLFENDQIRIPNDNVLLNQLFQFERTITEGGTIRFKGRHDDCVMALALACFELTRERPIFIIKGA